VDPGSKRLHCFLPFRAFESFYNTSPFFFLNRIFSQSVTKKSQQSHIHVLLTFIM